MLGLSPSDIAQLEALKHPVVDRVLLLLKIINDDPTLVVYTTFAKYTAKVCSDIDSIEGNIVTRSTKDDKTFERINAFAKEIQSYLTTFKEGQLILKKMDLVEGHEVSNTSGKSRLETLADKNKQ